MNRREFFRKTWAAGCGVAAGALVGNTASAAVPTARHITAPDGFIEFGNYDNSIRSYNVRRMCWECVGPPIDFYSSDQELSVMKSRLVT